MEKANKQDSRRTKKWKAWSWIVLRISKFL